MGASDHPSAAPHLRLALSDGFVSFLGKANALLSTPEQYKPHRQQRIFRHIPIAANQMMPEASRAGAWGWVRGRPFRGAALDHSVRRRDDGAPLRGSDRPPRPSSSTRRSVPRSATPGSQRRSAMSGARPRECLRLRPEAWRSRTSAFHSHVIIFSEVVEAAPHARTSACAPSFGFAAAPDFPRRCRLVEDRRAGSRGAGPGGHWHC
jgi:hypothetical protein